MFDSEKDLFDGVPIIDLTIAKDISISIHGLAPKGKNVDSCELSLLFHASNVPGSKNVKHQELVGVLRVTRPVLEELIYQANTTLGSLINFVEEQERAKKNGQSE